MMSCVFVIVPVVAVSWPAICSIAGVAAGALGYRKLAQAAGTRQICEQKSGVNSVELDDENSKLLFEQVANEEKLLFERQGIRIEVSRDHRGRLKIGVEGEGKSKAELKAEGLKFMNQVRRQFAYQRVMEEMRKKGFQVVSEEVVEDRVRVRLRKYQ